MGVLRVKAGVRFTRIAPAGFRLLGAFEAVARRVQLRLTITCGCEGHAPRNPHTLGEAYDLRSHDLTTTQQGLVLRSVLRVLSEGAHDPVLVVGIGLATRGFYGQLESPGTANEHFHFQRRKDTVYP